MYSILVADDEKIGRKGVHFLLNQMEQDFDIIEAKNGKEALQYIQNHPLDILLTDIKMPFLDGIGLIKEALKVQPQLRVAIFSGYSDFEYAKTAMSLGVLEYILKPVNPEEFKATMVKMTKSVDELKATAKKEDQTEHLIKEHVLYNLVNGNSRKALEDRFGKELIDSYLKKYHRIIMLACPDNFFGDHEEVKNHFLECIRIPFDYLNLNMTQSLFFFEEDRFDAVNAAAHDIFNMLQISFHTKGYLAISKSLKGLEDVEKTVDELEETLEGMYYHPEKYIYSEQDEKVTVKPYEDVEELTKKVKHDINLKDIDRLKEDFKSFNEIYYAQNDFSNDYLKFLFSGIIKDIYNILTVTDEKDLDTMIVRFYRANDYKSIKAIMDEFVALLEKEFKKSETLNHQEIKDVIRYVYNNYNLDLSVDSLADQVCLAPSYLSHIFKKETGENLGKFIKRVRMEKAKELLETSNEKIVSIAVAVGYANVSYFCQSFREYYGISPQKYRNRGEAAS